LIFQGLQKAGNTSGTPPAGGIVAVATFFGRGGSKEGAGEAAIDRRTNQPTEAPLDLTLRGEFERAGPEVVMREPAVGGLREGGGEGLQGALVQLSSLFHERLQVKGPDMLRGQRQFLAAHGGSSSETCGVFGWSCYDAACLLGLASPLLKRAASVDSRVLQLPCMIADTCI